MKHKQQDFNNKLDTLIQIALEEDGIDATSQAIFNKNERAVAKIVCKQNGILACLPQGLQVFKKLDTNVDIKTFYTNGDKINKGNIIAEIKGFVLDLLRGERVCLNILQRACGIATKTHELSELISHTKARLLDTRKTVPGLRFLDKQAVAQGGGKNHRMGLFDMILIKDNHIDRAGGIKKAIENVKKSPYKNLPIEVECRTFEDVKTCLQSGIDRILLDNMSNDLMKKCVEIVEGKIPLEASGGITKASIRSVAQTGVDYISVGALTHSVIALDLSMYIDKKEN